MDAQSPHPSVGRCPLNTRSFSQPQNTIKVDEFEKVPSKPVSRRDVLKVGGIGAAATAFASVGSLAWTPRRVAQAASATTFSDIQFDIGAFVHPAQTVAGILVDFGVIYTFMAPATLTRNPTKSDQAVLSHALATIEANYSFSPSGVFTFVAYGQTYFNRLPSSVVKSHMPLRNDGSGKPVLEEAVPSPTDVSPLNPNVTKANSNFNVPVQIEHNDVLFILRSDQLCNVIDVAAWFNGSNSLNGNSVPSPAFNGLLNFQEPRLNFVQPGLPRQIADTAGFSFASSINPASSMWMGFVDQQVDASAPSAAVVTFAGTSHAHLTTAKAGDYFDNGSIIHLSHDIDDLPQFYRNDATVQEDFSERIQYMFRSKTHSKTPGLPFPQDANDGFTNGGGQGAPTGSLTTQQQSAFIKNDFFGTTDQDSNFDPAVLVDPTNPHKKYRVGHTSGLQRSSRASDGTPLHIRNDGPGLSGMDVVDGTITPTLEFLVFVPTSEFFRKMRINSASLDYVKTTDGGTATSVGPTEEASDGEDDGLERFLTATRRQNFLIPPRRHRSFPLLELT